jgi:hypothetical protein
VSAVPFDPASFKVATPTAFYIVFIADRQSER